MDTVTYEIIGGAMAALALGIGVQSTRRQQKVNSQTIEAEKTKLQTQVTQLTQENEKFVEALKLAQSTVTAIEQQLKKTTQQCTGLEKDLAQAQTESNQAKSQLQTAEAESQKTKTDLTGQIETLQNELQTQ
ncbi:MAG: hypothetical protein AAFR12_19890, partial [Cyanobacteria bacterium J06626_6]